MCSTASGDICTSERKSCTFMMFWLRMDFEVALFLCGLFILLLLFIYYLFFLLQGSEMKYINQCPKHVHCTYSVYKCTRPCCCVHVYLKMYNCKRFLVRFLSTGISTLCYDLGVLSSFFTGTVCLQMNLLH